MYKLIKHFRTPKAELLQSQLNKVADAALDAGFMDGNNFLCIAPKSEYISYNQKLGSAVSSRKIASCFGKSHKHVIRDIENAINELQKQAAQNWSLPPYSYRLYKKISNLNVLQILINLEQPENIFCLKAFLI